MTDGRINDLDFERTSENEAYGGDGIELEDFGRERFPDDPEKREQIRDNFLVSDPSNGGDPDEVDTFQDLSFPVVDPNGDLDDDNDTLHKGPLQDADSLATQTDAFGEQKQQELDNKINDLIDDNF